MKGLKGVDEWIHDTERVHVFVVATIFVFLFILVYCLRKVGTLNMSPAENKHTQIF